MLYSSIQKDCIVRRFEWQFELYFTYIFECKSGVRGLPRPGVKFKNALLYWHEIYIILQHQRSKANTSEILKNSCVKFEPRRLYITN